VTLFIRHARPLVDRDVPQDGWPLEPGAVEAVQPLARFVDPSVVVSPLRRTRETADALGLPYVADARIVEVEKPFVDDLDAAVTRYLNGDSLKGWEPQSDAIARFSSAIAEHGASTYVTHGLVLTLYLRSVVPELDSFPFWKTLGNPDAWKLIDGQLEHCVP
jgi:broad specificity phosphatase PhoE